MNPTNFDTVVIGAGIIGASVAMHLSKSRKGKVLLVEEEENFAEHQTGNNSGVIHSGLYYKPGSLKAKNCTEGSTLLYQFCENNSIPVKRCGKLVVASSPEEKSRLLSLYDRGLQNGLTGIRVLNSEEIKEFEPYVSGISALHVPHTGIVDYKKVTSAFINVLLTNEGEFRTSCSFESATYNLGVYRIITSNGEFTAKNLISCSGLYADKVALSCGIDPEIKIIPYRGEYHILKKEKEYLVRNLIYPVHDPAFPFLGVHFTRMIHGGVEAGPNAVPAFKRKGYSYSDFSFKEMSEFLTYPGYLKLSAKHFKMGAGEIYRSLYKPALVKKLQKLIPSIAGNDLEKGGAGVRAQALDKSGNLLDDFKIIIKDRMIHVLNASSPAATASISIGKYIADLVKD